MEWLRDKVVLLRLTTMRYFFNYKGEGISCFCQRRFSALEDPEKRRCFRTSDHKLIVEGNVEYYGLWRLVNTSYKVIEKFDKVCL